MSIPSDLSIDGVSVPIANSWGGPRVDLSGALEPVSWVVNHWIDGLFPDLSDLAERGEDASKEGFYAVKADDDLTEEDIATWRQLTNTELGTEPLLVGSILARPRPSIVVPRNFLLAILRGISKIRREAAMLPRLPPLPEHPSIAGRPPGLFTHTTTNQGPYEDERIALGAVEDTAVALASAETRATTIEDLANVAMMRRRLLETLDSYALLDEKRATEKRAWLEGFRLPALRDYVDAAIALRAYYRAPERAQYIREPAPQRLLDGAVSLDWFRKPTQPPPGQTGERWLAFAERLLREGPRGGDAGEISTGVADRRYNILWRCDYDKPAVVATRETLS